jgi:hypothetical protein
MYAASRIVNLDETFLLAALRGLRLVWFKSVRISFSLLTSFAGKCRLPDLNFRKTSRCSSFDPPLAALAGAGTAILTQTGASENAYDEERTRTHLAC